MTMEILLLVSIIGLTLMLLLKSLELKRDKEILASRGLKRVALSLEQSSLVVLKKVSAFDKHKAKEIFSFSLIWLADLYKKTQGNITERLSRMSRPNGDSVLNKNAKESSVYLKDILDHKNHIHSEIENNNIEIVEEYDESVKINEDAGDGESKQ